MGIDFRTAAEKMAETVLIDPVQHRRLGMHLIEYSQRQQLTELELTELLAMIGMAPPS